MKRVLVTGAGGFIGRHSLKLLQQAGFEVHGISRNSGSAAAPGLFWHRVDLMDYALVNDLLADLQATHLLHLAWYTEHGEFWSAPENLMWVASSLNLLKSFGEQGGQRVLMAGSCAEYDWTAGHCDALETPCLPSSLYGSSKNALRQIAAEYCRVNQLGFAWGRIFFPYGPGEAAKRFVTSVVDGLLKQETVACTQGSQLRDFIYVKDAASAFVRLLDSDLNAAVNIGSGDPVTLKAIAAEAMHLIGGDGRVDFGALTQRQDDPEVLTADVSELRNQLGWQPAYSLQQGLAETIDWRRGELSQT